MKMQINSISEYKLQFNYLDGHCLMVCAHFFSTINFHAFLHQSTRGAMSAGHLNINSSKFHSGGQFKLWELSSKQYLLIPTYIYYYCLHKHIVIFDKSCVLRYSYFCDSKYLFWMSPNICRDFTITLCLKCNWLLGSTDTSAVFGTMGCRQKTF